ncbi:MAG: hypothetical protein ACXW3D_00930 [Caulobacteraceae bacterium]
MNPSDLAFLTAFVCGVAWIGLSTYWEFVRPHQPDTAQGLTILFKGAHKLVYVGATENMIFNALVIGSGLFTLITIALRLDAKSASENQNSDH